MKNKLLEETVDCLVDAKTKTKRFRKKNAEIFEKFEALEKEEARLEGVVRELAKDAGTPGETVVLVDTDDAKIQVIGGFKSVTYDGLAFMKKVEPKIFIKIVSVDPKKVKALVELGEIYEATEVECRNPREPLDPKVKIEVFR